MQYTDETYDKDKFLRGQYFGKFLNSLKISLLKKKYGPLKTHLCRVLKIIQFELPDVKIIQTEILEMV